MWRNNVKKLRKQDDISIEQGNPIGSYLDDLNKYLGDGSSDVKMLTADELHAYKLMKKFDNSSYNKRFNLTQVIEKLTENRGLTGPAELNIQILSRNLDAANSDSIAFNQTLDALLFCLSNQKVSLYDIQNEIQPQLTHK